MESIEIAKKLEGINTLEMVREKLNVQKSTAIKMLSLLRKEGFVETSGGGKKPRLYTISPIRIAGKEHLGLYDIINNILGCIINAASFLYLWFLFNFCFVGGR